MGEKGKEGEERRGACVCASQESGDEDGREKVCARVQLTPFFHVALESCTRDGD